MENVISQSEYTTLPEPESGPGYIAVTAEAQIGAMDRFRRSRLCRVIAGGLIGLAGIGVAGKSAEWMINPASANAAMECTTTTVTSPDGTITTTQTECNDGSDAEPVQPPPAQAPATPNADTGNTPDKPHNGPNSNHHKHHTHKHQTIHGPKPDKTDSQKNFPGYNMGDTSFTDGNGCFITSAASALRRETGNSHITPKKIYFPALQRRWSPGGGVNGFLFDALPSIASHFDVKVYKTNFQGAVKAVRRGDEVMMLAAPGHFTSEGHYMDAWKVAGGNNLVIDDPNGKGKHGDSERPGGWSGAELRRAGIIDYRALHLRER